MSSLGTREGAFFISEKFTFKNIFLQTTGINNYKRIRETLRLPMNSSRHKLFSCPCFSKNQDRHIGGADHGNKLLDLSGSLAFSNKVIMDLNSLKVFLEDYRFFLQLFLFICLEYYIVKF